MQDPTGPTSATSYATRAHELVSALGDGEEVRRAAMTVSDLVGEATADMSNRVAHIFHALVSNVVPAREVESAIREAKELLAQGGIDPRVGDPLFAWAQKMSLLLEGEVLGGHDD